MGAPKKQKRKYETPKKPYDRARLEKEKKIKQDFGLRRKKEIWKAESVLRSFRQRARELQAKPDENKEKTLFEKMRKMGMPAKNMEDVLEVGLEDMLARRLQTIVHKKGLANSPLQARQFITHGHVLVDGRKSRWPSYIVAQGEEERVSLHPRMAKSMVEKEKEAGKK